METPHAGSRVRITRRVDGVDGTCLFEAIDAQGALVPGKRLAVVARMHGNEPVGDPVLQRVASEAERRLIAGSVLTVRANEAAAEIDQRHLPDGTDMNRLWDTTTQARLRAQAPHTLCYEERRAVELAPLLLACDGVLDLHSTSRPAAPFLVIRDDQAHTTLALQLGVEKLITGVHENGVLSGGVAANVGLSAGHGGPRLGFTFEAGQHTDPTNAERAWEVTERTLSGLGLWRSDLPPDTVRSEVFEVTERYRQATAGNEQYRFVGYEGGELAGGRRGLPPRQLHSFEEIQADEVILRRGRSEVVRADTPFTMLMPAPTTPPGTDLYYVAQPRRGGLTQGTARTDDDARREGLAIERMLDLLSDDEFERGSTYVAFDSRRLFDLCATVIGRTLRLEPGHPHRRISVIGRGDSGTDDAERRAGQRYRQAMRTAITSGLPVERIQLLRGAPLSWLDALTSHGMQELMDRRARTGSDHGVRMRVSLRQPHTASLLVGGDLDLAMQTGDTRHVRVALLIEAATVEPDGPTARVRVVRTGVVSTRPELIMAAGSLIQALRGEHRYLVRHGALRAEPAVRELLLDDDAIEAVADPIRMEGLRSALYRAQLRLWCDQLRLEFAAPVRLASEGDVGQWLARTMAATGILDADALRALAVRRDGSAWVADPEFVDRLYDRVHAAPTDNTPPVLLFGPTAPPSPPQPLFARDLVADDLERWVGWTRFVRGGQVLPGTRGKDLDIAFNGGDIRDTLTRWFDGARSLAERQPGDVMVVVAGDGMNPTRDRMSDAFALFRSHRAVVLDQNVHYLRIQHAQGTHLSWMKDFLSALDRRPPSAHSVALQFEVEHGATVNVVMVLERDRSAGVDARPWSLDGWDIACCAVVLSDLESKGGEDYKVGLFTERLNGQADRISQELIHFGRAHCEGLLIQAGARVRAEQGPLATRVLQQTLVQQIARWIERVRIWRHTSVTAPRDLEARGRWVARRLGLADARLARALAREMDRDTPPAVAAERLWESVPPWPGPSWNDRADEGASHPT